MELAQKFLNRIQHLLKKNPSKENRMLASSDDITSEGPTRKKIHKSDNFEKR